MADEKRADDQENLKNHSLPGTNMAGKGPSVGDRKVDKGPEQRNEKRADDQENLKNHSLPGTKMAGKGPSVGDRKIDKGPEQRRRDEDVQGREDEREK